MATKRRLFIIGNGFDLAHKMKTSYGDFVRWYLEKLRAEFFTSGISPDDTLLSIKFTPNYYGGRISPDGDIIEWIDGWLPKGRFNKGNSPIEVKFTSEFFKNIYNKVRYNWVDIENEYFKALMIINNRLELARKGNSDNVRKYKGYSIKKLNDELEEIRKVLIEYLTSLHTSEPDDQFIEIFTKGRYTQQLILSFNYTDTIEKYLPKVKEKVSDTQLVFIHGSLTDDKDGDVIFGLGDEHHNDLDNIHNSDNLSELYRFNKSNWYFLEDNYTKLLRFIDPAVYDVEIIGHACGLSDRTLFKEILEHNNCGNVTTFHWPDKSDYYNKTVELSRHFDDKRKSRRKIQPYSENHLIPNIE